MPTIPTRASNSTTSNPHGATQKMQIGIDSFAAAISDPATGATLAPAERLNHLLEEIVQAAQPALDVFATGEPHRAESLDPPPAVILAAAATRTKNIRLASAV